MLLTISFDMKSHTDPHLNDSPAVSSRRLPLFLLDPSGSEQAVNLIERPVPGIALAMFGPLCLGDESSGQDTTLRCLAVTQDGTFAASIQISHGQHKDPNALWKQVSDHLATARQCPIPAASLGWCITSEDCLKAWSAPSFWIGIDTQVQPTFSEQIDAGIGHVLKSLEPELCDAITRRPRLSLLVAHRLIAMAKWHSPAAVTYAFQALRTESLGVLHLIASGQPENDARHVREAIFSGDSLPETFANLGIAKAVHRQSVCKPEPFYAKEVEPARSLSDLPISGRDWLVAMRLTQHLPLHGKEDWTEFSRLVEKLLSLNFQKSETASKLLEWCVRAGYRKCGYRLEQLISQAQAFILAARALASLEVTFDDAITRAMALQQPQPETVYQLAIGVTHISGKSIDELMGHIFDLHPGLPHAFQTSGDLTIHALSSLEQANLHGTDGDNCLQYRENTLRYVAEGAALYGVRTESGVVGTLALRYDRTEDTPKVEVQEVTGVKNGISRIHPLDLSRLAQSFADSWNSQQHVDTWLAYEDRCAQWRHRALLIDTQLSQ